MKIIRKIFIINQNEQLEKDLGISLTQDERSLFKFTKLSHSKQIKKKVKKL